MKEIMKDRSVRLYTILQAVFTMGAFITSGTYVTFLQEKGMSLLQVNTVNSAYFLVLFICEIPTGAFADIFGRKQSFLVACVLRGFASVIYGMSQSFWGK